MPETGQCSCTPDWRQGAWLLLDAAGPDTAVGWIQDGEFKALQSSSLPTLECLPALLQAILGQAGLRVQDCSGFIYGSGPGSVLGLRMVALMLRSWLSLPTLRGIGVCQFHHLEVALSALLLEGMAVDAVYAAWRSDRFHCVRFCSTEPYPWLRGSVDAGRLPDEAYGVLLGNRALPDALAACFHEFPRARLCAVLQAFPQLLSQTLWPTPYSAAATDFAIWDARPHSRTR